MIKFSQANLESLVNDYLKEDLKELERFISNYNEDIMEYVQLQNTLLTLDEIMKGSFRTQMNIGGNIFMEAKVECPAHMVLVDVGKGCFLQFTLEEALKFVEFKVRSLTKECDVLREETVKKRSDIKLALLCIDEQEHSRL